MKITKGHNSDNIGGLKIKVFMHIYTSCQVTVQSLKAIQAKL